MNRSTNYQKQVVLKLLSSKFVHMKMPSLQFIKKLTIHSTVSSKNPEVGSANLNILFGRRPSFIRTLRRQEKEYRLVYLNLTSHKRYIAPDLDCLACTILPFQLENRLSPVKPMKSDESSWTVENCTPATPLHPLLFPYPTRDDPFNLTLLLTHKEISLPTIIFYLNLFQISATIK